MGILTKKGQVSVLRYDERITIRATLRQIINEVLVQYPPMNRLRILEDIISVASVMLLDYSEEEKKEE